MITQYDLTTTKPSDVRELFTVMFGGEQIEAAFGVDTPEEADAVLAQYSADPAHDGHTALVTLAGVPIDYAVVAYQPGN